MAETRRAYKSLGKALHDIRKRRGWKLRELEDRCDLRFTFLSQIERGDRFPSADSLDAILTALDVEPKLRERVIRIAMAETAQDYRALLQQEAS